MLVHTYYGFTATRRARRGRRGRGPRGAHSLSSSAFVLVMISLAVYGQSGNFNLAG